MAVINDAGIKLIKEFESCRLEAYLDTRGIPTIGYGATGPDIHMGMVWTQEQADERFSDDLLVKAETPVNNLVKVPLNSNQFSAICSLVYNIGSGNFRNSHVLAYINSEWYDEVPDRILAWDKNHDGTVSDGLLRRRQSEVQLWGTPC